jgi:anti-sigma factor RsiW
VRDPGQRRDGLEAGHLGAVSDEIICRQFVEVITDYFEGALPPRDTALVEEHLVMCDWCVTYAEQMKMIATSLRSLVEGNAPAPPGSLFALLRQGRGLSG